MDENKSGLYIVAIVGVIAVVAMVVMITGVSVSGPSEDATGQAIKKATQAETQCVSDCLKNDENPNLSYCKSACGLNQDAEPA